MKKTLLFLFITFSFSFIGFGQDVWHQLPPLSPGGTGTVNPESSDIVTTDDGIIYASYMYDNGVDGLRLYIMKYNAGAGTWGLLYNDVTYDGMQQIKSCKIGNVAYIVTRVGNAAGGPIWRVYSATAGIVSPYSDFTLSDYSASSGFDFEMGTDASYGYLFYKGSSQLLSLGRIDYANDLLTTEVVALPNSAIANSWDMTVAGDSVFMAAAVSTPTYNAYLLKAGPAGDVILPYTSSSPDGQLLNPGPVSTNTVVVNSDGSEKVHVTLYDFGNMAAYEKIYENAALTDITYIGTIAQSYTQSATTGRPDMLYAFNNYSPANAFPYNSYVVSYQISTGVFDTIGTPGNYVLATNAPDEHRLSYSEGTKRFAVSYFDTDILLHDYYLTNLVPSLDPENADIVGNMCELQASTIFNNVAFTDENGDYLSVIGFQSSDTAILDPANVGFNDAGQNGTLHNFYVYGVAGQTGTVTLTVQVTDGWDTVWLQLPAVTVVAPNPPSYNTAAVSLCSGQGDINLFDYVSLTGGRFYIGSLEIDFENGVFPTDASPLGAEDPQQLTYELYDGACTYYVDAPIVFHHSPMVSVTNTPTNCGLSTGTATALVSGGATPYAFSQWSSGEQNMNNVSDLSAGQHSYMLTDANSCSVMTFFNILSVGANATGTVTDVSCHGLSDGSIALSTTGMTAPIESMWSCGHSTLNLAGVPAGNYTVDLIDATGCMISKTFVIGEPEALLTEVSTTSPNCEQADGAMGVFQTTGGVSPYSYAWSNGDTGPASNNVPFGIYSLTTTDDNGCQSINTIYLGELGAADLSGTVTPSNCGAEEGAINVFPGIPFGESVASILWSNGATTEDIEELAPAVYVCTLELTNNCTAVRAWEIPVVEPLRNDICVVTVDSATTTNLVVWEKVQSTGIAYYTIYRETSVQGEFILIDTVHAANLSVFNDVVASPTARSWRYKIGAVNGCGVEGPLSAAHQTIHLDVLDNSGTNVTINWNEYQGAAFSSYVVSRYTDAAGWEVLATVPVTILSYTDTVTFSTPGLDYMVEIELDESCTATLWKSQDFNSSRSNKDKGQFSVGNGTGDSHNSIAEGYLHTIQVSPNPTTGLLHIVQKEAKMVSIQVRSIEGQLMQTLVSSSMSEQLDMSGFANGIYFITLSMDNAQQTLRIVKQ
jgi:hypothetical protein